MTSRLKTTLAASTAAFVLGGLGVGGMTYAVAQNEDQDDGEQVRSEDAGPQLMRPDPAFVQQLSFADLVEDVSPAVVSIRTEREVQTPRFSGIPPEFQRMFPQLRGREGFGGDRGPRRATGEGSGFFIDENGHIVTNNHVIDGAEEITVALNDGTELEATLVGTDPATDIAVLKVEPSSEQRYVQFSPNADLRVGDYVLAVGNPFGLGGSVTSGIVSAIGGDDRDGTYADFIQIDASINRGNSGGPTFDLRGNVVGVNTAIVSPTGGNVGIGLAVPADTANEVVSQIIVEGAVTRGWLGVGIGDLDERLASAVGLDEPNGALIGSVQEGSPAQKAGLEEGDVILAFDGTPISGATELTRTVGRTSPGQRVSIRFLRDGDEQTATVRLDRREAEDRVASTFGGTPDFRAEETEIEGLGVTFSPLTEEARAELGLGDEAGGVLVTEVADDSEAAEAGIRAGMVITEADGREVARVEDVEEVVKMAKERGKEAVLVRVLRPGGSRDFRALPVTSG